MINIFGVNSKALQAILTLTTGTLLSQIIPIIVSPILTRMYSPQEFGILALFSSLLAILTTISMGRFEVTILLPRKDSYARNLTVISIIICGLFSLLLLIAIILFGENLADMLNAPALSKWLYLIPFGVFLGGIYQALYCWLNRKAIYRTITTSRILQSGSASTINILGGLSDLGVSGLIVGQFAGLVLSAVILIGSVLSKFGESFFLIEKIQCLALARRYRNFPKYLVVAHGLNTLASQLPIILFSAYFGGSNVGYLLLAIRICRVPITVISSAIGDVFRREASIQFSKTGNCKAIYLDTMKNLISISIMPFLLMLFLAPALFSFIFGKTWYMTGSCVQILIPMIFLQFVISPLSSLFMIAEKQKLDLVWQLINLFIIAGSIFIGFIFDQNFTTTLILYSFLGCLSYFINGIVSYRLAAGENDVL